MHFRNLLSALACALLFCFLGGCGAENKANSSPRNAGDVLNGMRLKKLTKDLSLTGEQEIKVKAMLDEEGKGVARIHDEPNLSVLEKTIKIRALRDETYGKIRPLLTPTQLEKLEEVLRKSEKRTKTN